MAGENKAPSWAEQWGSGGADDGRELTKANPGDGSGGGEKIAKAKAVATAGLGKAKTAAAVGAEKMKVGAAVGAQKVKAGTKLGLKWVKAQYEKRTSK